MKKGILLSAAIGLSMMMLAGCGETYGYEDAENYTLNKCDASSEELVTVGVGGPWSYDEDSSIDEKDMFLDHEDGGYIYISNESLEPLYSYAAAWVAGESVDNATKIMLERNGYTDCDYDFEVIGSAFEGSDLILAEESFTLDEEQDYEGKYLLIQYSDDGYIEFLTVNFYYMDTDDWTDEDYVELARNLFGK